MMNQAASATRRAPTDSSPPSACCPMLNAPFFGLPTPAAAPQCFMSSQTQQIIQLSRQPQQQSNVASQPPQQQSVSQQSPPLVDQQQQQLQAQPQQQPTQRSHDQTSNNYSTSIAPPNLSLQHLLASRHPASSCMALAAALASFPHFQQQQQQLLTQNHQATPINQTTQNVAHSTPLNHVAQPNPSPTFTNEVPILNYNSYPSAQPFINLPTLPQSVPPAAAHLSHQHQTNNIPNILSTNLSTIAQNALSNSATNIHHNVQPPRPLVTNTALNSSPGQLPNSIYRSAQPQSTDQAPNVHQQQPSNPTPAQQLGQATRSILSDETLNLFNDQIQAILLNQLFSNHQFAPSLSANPIQSQQLTASQQLINTSRAQTALPPTGQSPVVMTPAQQVTPTHIAPPQQHQPSLEQTSENLNQEQAFHQSNIQSRVNQAPQPPLTNDSYPSSVNRTTSSSYQSQTNNDLHIQRSPSDPVLQAHQTTQTLAQQPPPIQPQSHQQQQHPQPQTNLPPMSFYTYPQERAMEQAIAILANPQVANNIFSHVFMFLQSGLRSESHHAHHHHPAHHFHHLHGAHHHHHHHGQSGQPNGQDASMPLDSLAINESKPRGLSRAEIDSLTPYIHTNEKDPLTCVICLSKFELKSKIRPLPCNHAFHAKCVDKWLRTNRTCPICRRDALKTFNGKIKRI